MAVTPTTWDPAHKSSNCTLSGGNLTASSGGGDNGPVRSVFGAASGKYYWELKYTGLLPITGVALASWVLTDYPGYGSGSIGFNGGSPAKKVKDATQTDYGSVWNGTTGILGIALDMDSGTVSIYVDGVDKGVMFSGLTGTYYAATGSSSSSSAVTTANFGATAFAYTPPAGFQAGFGEPLAAYALSGTVRDATGALASRKVAAYREDTNALVGTTTSDATTGVYSIANLADTAHTLVFYPALGENLNALVRRGVLPIET